MPLFLRVKDAHPLHRCAFRVGICCMRYGIVDRRHEPFQRNGLYRDNGTHRAWRIGINHFRVAIYRRSEEANVFGEQSCRSGFFHRGC